MARKFEQIESNDDGDRVERSGFTSINMTELLSKDVLCSLFDYLYTCMTTCTLPHKGMVEILEPCMDEVNRTLAGMISSGEVVVADRGEDETLESTVVDVEYFAYAIEAALIERLESYLEETEQQ